MQSFKMYISPKRYLEKISVNSSSSLYSVARNIHSDPLLIEEPLQFAHQVGFELEADARYLRRLNPPVHNRNIIAEATEGLKDLRIRFVAE